MHPIYRTGVPLLPRVRFLYVYPTNIFNYFLAPSSFIAPQNVMYFLMFPFLVHRIFTFIYKSRLKLGNACYHSVQNLLSSGLLSKNLKIKIYRTIILPVVLYGCETWSLTLRGERRLRVFENSVEESIWT